MQDRIGDLRELVAHLNPNSVGLIRSGCSAVFDAALLRDNGFDIEAQLGIRREEEEYQFMGSGQQKLEMLTEGISSIKLTMTQIRALKHSAVEATSPEQEKVISNELNGLLAKSNREVMKVKRGLEELKQENVAFAAKNGSSSESKMRENLLAAVTRKFRGMLKEYQALQTEFKKDVRDKVSRQVKIVFPDANEEEVSKIVDDGDVSAAAAIRMRISGQAHEGLKNALSDIQDKHRDIQRLEQGVVELHQMFVDLATLVDAQSELLDQIDVSVNSAKDYTEKGEKELVHARKDQKKAKKRMCWLSVCIMFLAVIIMIPIIILVR